MINCTSAEKLCAFVLGGPETLPPVTSFHAEQLEAVYALEASALHEGGSCVPASFPSKQLMFLQGSSDPQDELQTNSRYAESAV